MLLRCPVCGSKNFFVPRRDADGTTLLFSVNDNGDVVNSHPADNASAITADTVFCCSGCVWSGTVAQLKEEQR